MEEDTLLYRALMPLSRPYRGFSEPELFTVALVPLGATYVAGALWFGWGLWSAGYEQPLSELLPVLSLVTLVFWLVSAPALFEWKRQLAERYREIDYPE